MGEGGYWGCSSMEVTPLSPLFAERFTDVIGIPLAFRTAIGTSPGMVFLAMLIYGIGEVFQPIFIIRFIGHDFIIPFLV